jgi:hypothetical protein
MNYYTPNISEIRVGFRYEYKTHHTGTIMFFGKDVEIPTEWDEWRKAEVMPDEWYIGIDKPNIEWFGKMISEGAIRTSKEFYNVP